MVGYCKTPSCSYQARKMCLPLLSSLAHRKAGKKMKKSKMAHIRKEILDAAEAVGAPP
jgi:hypothetical protein